MDAIILHRDYSGIGHSEYFIAGDWTDEQIKERFPGGEMFSIERGTLNGDTFGVFVKVW